MAIDVCVEQQRAGQVCEWDVVIVASRDNNDHVAYEILATHTPTQTQCKSAHRYSALLKVGIPVFRMANKRINPHVDQLHESLASRYASAMDGVLFPPKKVCLVLQTKSRYCIP